MLPQINLNMSFSPNHHVYIFAAIQWIRCAKLENVKNVPCKHLVESTCHSPSVKGVGVFYLPAELLSIFSDMVSKLAIT